MGLLVVNLLVGLSCALPLALWRIERRNRSGSGSPEGVVRAGSVSHASPIGLLLAATLAMLIAAPVRAEPAGADPDAVVERFFEAYRSVPPIRI